MKHELWDIAVEVTVTPLTQDGQVDYETRPEYKTYTVVACDHQTATALAIHKARDENGADCSIRSFKAQYVKRHQ